MSAFKGFKIGDHVRIERDEKRWPSRGSWPRYRGKVGTVVQLNRRDGEIGVVLGAPVDVSKAATGGLGKVSWFLPHELVPASAQNHPDSRSERAIGASEASARRRPQSERT